MSDQAVPGKKIRRLPADQWNDMVAAARFFRESRLSLDSEGGGFDYPEPGFIKIRNDTGTALPRFSIVAIGDPWTTPSLGGSTLDVFKTRKTCSASVPAETNRGKFAILVDGCAPGGVVDAIASGVVQCQVQVDEGEEDYEWADIEPDSTEVLHAATSGSARILWKESGTGTKWAQVRISNKAPTSTTIPTAIMFNGNGYNGDASFKNRLKYYGVSHASNRGVYIHFINGWGDFATTGVTMLTTATSVGAGTHSYTDSMFKLTQTGLYRFIVRGYLEQDSSYGQGYITTSGTTGSTSGHTHTYDYRQDRLEQSRIDCRLNWRNPGGGAWQQTTERMLAWGPQMNLSSLTLSALDTQYVQFDCVFWQMVGTANREYRLGFSLAAWWDTFSPAFDHAQWSFAADSGLIAVSRMGDYAADQTLAY